MCGDYKQPIVKQNVGHPELDLANATRDDDDVLKNAMKMVGSLYESFHQRHDETNDAHIQSTTLPIEFTTARLSPRVKVGVRKIQVKGNFKRTRLSSDERGGC
ncbi:zinc finger BED domain-containing protein RICESLEEPER 2-like [Salvia divinorum]|uniref:Zinc finger BED domain-containing protein RICESLEEPER 2-like n=1 Tax=Salvia divinorum TaxID=28513 RepID=A0ABD1GN79_SALDI